MPKEQPTVRQRNLRKLIAQWGGGEALAKKLGYANGSYLSHMATGHRPITEKTARAIEQKLQLPLGWMDSDHNNGRKHLATVAVAAVDTTLFAQVVEAVSTAMQELGIDLSLEKFEEVVSFAYEHSLEKREVDQVLLRKMLRLAR
jgi:hypothetical protein